jgi:hypothetical protein
VVKTVHALTPDHRIFVVFHALPQYFTQTLLKWRNAMKLLRLVLIVTVLLGTLRPAQASPATWVHLMLATGMIDSQTLDSNLKVYETLLSSLEKNARNPAHSMEIVKDLELRLHRQLGTAGTYLGNQIAPEFQAAVFHAKQAIQKHDANRVIHYARVAKTEIQSLKGSL